MSNTFLLETANTEDLEAELARRKAALLLPMPSPLATLDLQELQEMCSNYLHDLAGDSYVDDDYDQYIYEASLEALYGKDVFKWINARVRER